MALSMRADSQLAAWLAKLDDLAIVASVTASGQERQCVETLQHLLATGPASVPAIACTAPDRQRLAALLTLEAWESAVLMLLPRQAGLMASRGANDCWIVTLMLPGSALEYTNTGKSLALAMIAALAMAFAEYHLCGRPTVPAVSFNRGNRVQNI